MKLKIKIKYFGETINKYEKDGYVEVYVTYEVIENIGANEKIVF